MSDIMNPAHLLLEATVEARKRKLQGASLATLLIILDAPQNMDTLAKKIGVTPSSMTGLADKLFMRDLVRRSSVKGDRRQWELKITAKGIALVEAILNLQ